MNTSTRWTAAGFEALIATEPSPFYQRPAAYSLLRCVPRSECKASIAVRPSFLCESCSTTCSATISRAHLPRERGTCRVRSVAHLHVVAEQAAQPEPDRFQVVGKPLQTVTDKQSRTVPFAAGYQHADDSVDALREDAKYLGGVWGGVTREDMGNDPPSIRWMKGTGSLTTEGISWSVTKYCRALACCAAGSPTSSG